VLSGFSQIQIGFKNLLKNGFEKLEKEKEKEIHLHSDFGPLLFAAQRARPIFSLPPAPAPAFGSLGPSPSRGLLAHLHVRSRVPHRATDMRDPPVSVRFPFLSSSSGSFHRRTPPSVIRIPFEIFLLSITGDAYEL
jgi:hypothetical protein